MKTSSRYSTAFFAMLVIFILASLVLIPIPFTRDQGIYAYNGWRWLADDTLYADTFGHKGPLLYIIYAVCLDLSGGAMWAVNLADIVFRAATVAFVFLAAREISGSRASLLAALFAALPLAGVFNSCWWNAQAETFMLPALAGSAWLLLRFQRKGQAWNLALAGFIAAQAVMLKWSAFAHVLLLYLWIVIVSRGPAQALTDTKGLARLRTHGIGAGFLLGVILWLFYLAVAGALSDMWELAVVFNSFHARAAFAGFDLSSVELFFVRANHVFSFVPLCVLGLAIKRDSRRIDEGTAFALLWLLIALLQLFSQARFFLYHYLVVIPPLAVVAAVGMERAWKKLADLLSAKSATIIAGLFLAALVLVFAVRFYCITRSYQTFAYLAGDISRSEYWSRFSEDDESGKGDFNFLATTAAASYARENSAPNSTLLVFGYEPLMNYLAGRPAPTRFEIDYPLTFEPRSKRAHEYREKFRKQFMSEIKADPPLLVALVDNDRNAIEPRSSLQQAKEFREFHTWLLKNYRRSDTIEDFHFFIRKEPARTE